MKSIFSAMRAKPKKVVDPNAPPRPNLLNHEKRLKETTGTVEGLAEENRELRRRLEAIESKLLHQTNYLNTLHQYVHTRLKN